MGNTLYIDSNVKRFTEDKITSLPITLLTNVIMPISVKSNMQYHVTDYEGNRLYIDYDGNITGNEYDYSLSDDEMYNTNDAGTVIGNAPVPKMLFRTNKQKNRPYLKNGYKTELVVIDEYNCLSQQVDDVLYEDASNLLEESQFNKAIIDIMDCIVGGNYSNYCSYKVTLNSNEHVIFNMEANVREAIMMYNIPNDLDIYINSIKIAKDNIDKYMGIYHNLQSTDLNIKLVNNTMNTVSIINPIILFT